MQHKRNKELAQHVYCMSQKSVNRLLNRKLKYITELFEHPIHEKDEHEIQPGTGHESTQGQ